MVVASCITVFGQFHFVLLVQFYCDTVIHVTAACTHMHQGMALFIYYVAFASQSNRWIQSTGCVRASDVESVELRRPVVPT